MKRGRKIILITIVAIVVVVAGLFAPRAIEMYTFNKVEHEQSVVLCDEYLRKYPDGKYTKDVLSIKIFASKEPQTTIKTIDQYLEKFPNDEDNVVYKGFKEYLLSNPDASTIEDYRDYLSSEKE